MEYIKGDGVLLLKLCYKISVLLALSIFGSSDLEREEVIWQGVGDIRPIVEKNWDLQPNSSLKELILPTTNHVIEYGRGLPQFYL